MALIGLLGAGVLALAGMVLLVSDPARRNALPLLDSPGVETNAADSTSPLGV
ncbi:hypothetical protein [Halomonas halmophila]|uniref:Uncharacterized protein n=1 Tax=Halomonas halmophila TaxID=252 RepID=A0A4Y4EWK6_9GAMM|nr:hypothetical protein [Halomonas halmophila]GED21496.1 hypothetical protein HHA01_04730 [Halomonas halmophila]